MKQANKTQMEQLNYYSTIKNTCRPLLTTDGQLIAVWQLRGQGQLSVRGSGRANQECGKLWLGAFIRGIIVDVRMKVQRGGTRADNERMCAIRAPIQRDWLQ